MIRRNPILLIALVGCTTWLLVSAPASAQGPELGKLRRQQFAQQQAQNLARQLVSRVLDLQAAQLEENGLTDLPIYQDIRGMGSNIDRLVENEMSGVVELLVKAQEADPETRGPLVTQARDEVRGILLALMTERQRLFRRLQLARLEAQTRELISVQRRVEIQTRDLPRRAVRERDALALTALAGQRDTGVMFENLVEMVDEVSRWGGQIGASALAGKQSLQETETETWLAKAETSLTGGEFLPAADNQREVINGLRKLLEKLQQSRSSADRELEAALTSVSELIADQLNIKEESQETPLTPEKADELSQRQDDVSQRIQDLARQLDEFTSAQAPLEAGQKAASEAAEQLFEQQQAEAIESQEAVVASLEALRDMMEIKAQTIQPEKSADQLAEEIAKMQSAQDKLAEAQSLQQESQNAWDQEDKPNPKAAQEAQKKALDKLAEAARTTDLPPHVEPLLNQAQQMAEKAQDQLANADAANPEQAAAVAEALEQATDATRQSLEELSSTLADTQRKQLATAVAELARAAEALDRAAASERDISRQLAAAAESGEQVSASDLAEMKKTQAQIERVVERAKSGTEQTAPAAQESLAKAMEKVQAATESLPEKGAAEGDASSDSADAPGESASDSADGAAAESAAESGSESAGQPEGANPAPAGESPNPQPTGEAAQQLAEAANLLREEAKNAARELSRTAQGQLDQIDSAQSELAQMSQQSEKPQPSQLNQVADDVGQIAPEAAAMLRNQADQAAQMAMQDSGADSPSTTEPGSEQSGDTPMGDNPAGNEPAGSEPAGSEPAGGEPATDQAAGSDAGGEETGASEPPAGSMPMNSGPAAPSTEQAMASLAGRRMPIAQDKAAADQLAMLLDNMQASRDEIGALANQFLEEQAALAAATPAGEAAGEASGEPQPGGPAEGASGEAPMDGAPSNATPGEAGSAGQPSGEGAPPSGNQPPANESAAPTSEVARQLSNSMRQFAQQQRQTGQLASQVAEQSQIANMPVRQALEAASQLPLAMLPPGMEAALADQMAASGEAAGEASGQASGEAAGDPMGQAAGEPGPSGEPSGGGEPGGESGESGGPPASGSPSGPGASTEMGTGFVSEAAQATAEAIAGAEAMQALAAVLPPSARQENWESMPAGARDEDGSMAAAAAMSENAAASAEAAAEGASAGEPSDDPGSPGNSGAPMGSSEGGEGSEGQPQEEMAAGARPGDAETQTRSFEREPWFTKLPPGVQQSIRASLRRAPPKGYEERLKLYFQNIE